MILEVHQIYYCFFVLYNDGSLFCDITKDKIVSSVKYFPGGTYEGSIIAVGKSFFWRFRMHSGIHEKLPEAGI